ncbi:MAG TPA: gamma-glutamyl-gamma-aminobutyrate hydrolase family protein [Myxococcota bacterium]|nr:gamma-glutamyl-gamma-aminobutyrate hydrolase family protein [Myxococcota bacterium]
MNKTISRLGALACLLLIALPLPVPAAEPALRVNILITHPRASELENFARLVERGLLQVPGLRLTGIYSSQESEDYQDARNYVLGRAPGWIHLRKISCELSSEKVFGRNDCSPIFDKLFADSAGIVFTGGPDIPPSLYGQKTLLTTVIEDPPRHWFEISFLYHLLGGDRGEKRVPLLTRRPAYMVLGLCLGMQSINVATGGTLVQDIPSHIYGVKTFEDGLRLPDEKVHRSFSAPLYPAAGEGWAVVHPIRLTGGADFTKTLLPEGGTVSVLSLHHQAIAGLGRGLDVWATSEDGKVIEAIRHSKYPGMIGVQFHPEKEILFDAGPSPAQHIAVWFEGDRRAQAFESSFWKMISKKVLESAKQAGGRHR